MNKPAELYNGVEICVAKTPGEWRKWLQKNSEEKDSVWLIIYKKQSGIKSVYYPEAVDEALCFGWIDSKANRRDADSYYQYFSKRNAKSKWSNLNKTKVKMLIKEKRMQPQGMKMIEIAKETGTWTALDKVEKIYLPKELADQFKKDRIAFEYWKKFPPSAKKAILQWIDNARKPETRMNRILETITKAHDNIRANQYIRK
ncbi:YdeI/OmpD-associated family protein [soil metagenome]